jgi:DNA-binding transcriptional MerR regulator
LAKLSGEFGLTVQETAERTGLSVHTLRYYEKAGLIDRVVRDGNSGHRRYSDEDLARIHFLQKMRATGMPIWQLQRYVQLLQHGNSTLVERRQMLEGHRTRVCEQIAELSDCLHLIEYKINNYQHLESARHSDSSDPDDDCQQAIHQENRSNGPQTLWVDRRDK